MKLLVLLIVLTCFYLKLTPRIITFHLMETYIGFCDRLFGKKEWFQQMPGFIFIVFVASMLLSIIDGFFNQGNFLIIIKLALEVYLLLSVLQQLILIKFQINTPVLAPEAVDLGKFNQLPASVWTNAYIWVAPIFWYAFFGVFGLSVYWVMACLQSTSRNSWQAPARHWLEILVWIPARLLALSYVIVGAFSQAIKIWNEYLMTGAAFNQFLLKRCMLSAVSPSDTVERVERDAMILLVGFYTIIIVLSWFL